MRTPSVVLVWLQGRSTEKMPHRRGGPRCQACATPRARARVPNTPPLLVCRRLRSLLCQVLASSVVSIIFSNLMHALQWALAISLAASSALLPSSGGGGLGRALAPPGLRRAHARAGLATAVAVGVVMSVGARVSARVWARGEPLPTWAPTHTEALDGHVGVLAVVLARQRDQPQTQARVPSLSRGLGRACLVRSGGGAGPRPPRDRARGLASRRARRSASRWTRSSRCSCTRPARCCCARAATPRSWPASRSCASSSRAHNAPGPVAGAPRSCRQARREGGTPRPS